MQRRALIIGSQTLGLTGVHNDVEAIGPRLEARGFDLDVRTESRATYEEICKGLEQLIEASTPSDAVVIYYSGHGARVVNPRRGQPRPDGRLEPELFHSLVPYDWSSTKFRGLLDSELSWYLARLTEKTRNVSIILDCCHSARMWKVIGEEEPPLARAIDGVKIPGVEAVVDEVRKRDDSGLHGELNPYAVRLVACEPDRSAYELRVSVAGEFRRMGLLTGTLIQLLDDLQNARVSWRTLGMLLRERVMDRIPIQRPEVEGADQRYLFELGTAERGGGVVYFLDDGKPALRTSRLLGAEVGARYAIMPLGRSEYDEAATIADATITRFEGAASHVDLQLRDPTKSVPLGVMAFHVAGPLGKRSVRIEGEGPAADALRTRLQDNRYVTEAAEADVPFLHARAAGDLVVLHDADGHPLTTGLAAGAAVVGLECRARAAMLRDLGDGELRARFELEWGRVVDGQRQPMESGDAMYAGDRLYVRFENKESEPLLFSVLNIGIDGTIALLTKASPMGTKVEPGKDYPLGLQLGRKGMAVSWPNDVPPERPLPESLIVIVSTDPHDFSALETGRSAHPKGPRTPLERVVQQLGSGGGRNVASEEVVESGAYCVRRIDFVLHSQRREPA